MTAGSSVAVVIPCYGHAHVLADAIESVLGQSAPAAEIIVVDDGFDDEVRDVVRNFPSVTLVRQQNRGLAAARNAGARAATSQKIVFLDADDQLLPQGLEQGLKCFDRHPDAAFVYGGFVAVEGDKQWPRFIRADTREDLIRCNWIGCIDAVMFELDKLRAEGGFDETLGMSEDWDAYLRLSRKYAFAAHENVVALYFKHDSNMSNDVPELMRWTNIVREREKQRGLTPAELIAWEEGDGVWRSIYHPLPVSLFRRGVRKFQGLLGRLAR